MDEPLAVALKFGFLVVLYLFLLWVARSAMRDLSRYEARLGRCRAGPAAEPTAPRLRPARPALGVSPRLEVVAAMGHEPGATFDLTDGAMMGRSDGADIRVDDPFASSAHARIFPRGEFMYLEDMGSTNGTYLERAPGQDHRASQDGRPDPHRRQRIPLPGVVASAMPLRIIEQAGRSDVGRQRSANEDSLVLRPPVLRGGRRHGRSQGRRGGLGDSGRGVRAGGRRR